MHFESKEIFNGFLKPDPPIDKLRGERQSLREEFAVCQRNNNYRLSSETFPERQLEHASYFADSHNEEDSQMGLDIINKLKQLINWNTAPSHYTTAQSEGKRKRR